MVMEFSRLAISVRVAIEFNKKQLPMSAQFLTTDNSFVDIGLVSIGTLV
jgi:hypothetical protein